MITLNSLGKDFMVMVNDAASESLAHQGEIVQFTFNGTLCNIKGTYNGEWVERYYMDANIMGWKEIGPDYAPYTPEVFKQVTIARLKEKKKWHQYDIGRAEAEIFHINEELEELSK